jgi:DNA-binding CsgD family transcriptional regulator
MKLDWCASIGRMVDLIGTDEYPSALAGALRELMDFEFIVMFGYVRSARPLDLYDDFPPARHRLHVAEYQEGPYLLDPFFLATLGTVEPGLWRLSEIAPDRFYQGEYFRSYYGQTGLSEEVGFLIDVNADLTVVISLMRTERRFSNAEIRTLKGIWPVVDATVRRQWGDLPLTESQTPSDIEETIEQAFHTIGEGILTPRERQVVEHTLKGHSAEAVGKILGISSGTVRIHRRNVYSKLRISSQGELFSEFITAMLAASRH